LAGATHMRRSTVKLAGSIRQLMGVSSDKQDIIRDIMS
jgi:hypothetical protein